MSVNVADLIVTMQADISDLQVAFKKIQDANDQTQSSFGESLKALTAFAAGYLSLESGIEILKDSVNEAINAEKQTVLLQRAVENAGISYDEYSSQIDATIKATSEYAKVQDEVVQAALRRLILVTNDVAGSTKNLALVFDLARARGIDVEQAALIIGKAMEGNVSVLGRLLPDIKELTNLMGSNKQSAELAAAALDILRQRVGGAGGQFGQAEGAVRDMTVAFKELEEAWGKTLGPFIAEAAHDMAEFLNDLRTVDETIAKVIGDSSDVKGPAIPTIPKADPELTKEAIALENELTANLADEAQKRYAIIQKELGDRIEAIMHMGLTAAQQEQLITLANQVAAKETVDADRDAALAREQVERDLVTKLAPQSEARIAIVEKEFDDRIAAISKMAATTEEKEALITLASQVHKKEREDLEQEYVLKISNMEAQLSQNVLSIGQAREVQIDNQLTNRIDQIKKVAQTEEEQQRLITEAYNDAIVQRLAIGNTFVGAFYVQMQQIAASSTFSFASITQSFSSTLSQFIQGTNNFKKFWLSTLDQMLTGVINFVISWLAEMALGFIKHAAINAGLIASHTAMEETKTTVTTANETARTIISLSANKVMLGGVIASLSAIGAVGDAAMATLGEVVAVTAAVLAAIAAALTASIFGAPFAAGYAAAAAAVGVAGGAAVAAGLGAIQVAIGGAVAAAGTALAIPLAAGGIVTSPTLALIGEAGPEAVIPLSGSGGGSGGFSIKPAPIYLNGRQIADVMFEVEMPKKLRRQGIGR